MGLSRMAEGPQPATDNNTDFFYHFIHTYVYCNNLYMYALFLVGIVMSSLRPL